MTGNLNGDQINILLAQNALLYTDPIAPASCRVCFEQISPLIVAAMMFGAFLAFIIMALYKLARLFDVSVKLLFKAVSVLFFISVGLYMIAFASYIQAAWSMLITTVICYSVNTTTTEKLGRKKKK